MSRPRIVFFTGLGCDIRMMDPQRGIDADLDFQPWIEPRPDESLKDYSARLAGRIDQSTPFYLAGISLGGMVALEVARLMPSKGVILLSSCRSARGVPWMHRIVGHVMAASPGWFIHLGKTIVPHMRQLFGIVEASEVELFEAMMGDAPDELIRWSLKAVAGWKGGEAIDVPTFQVHAERDHILPLRLAGTVNHVVEAAGHAVTVTHPAEVNAAVNRWLMLRSPD